MNGNGSETKDPMKRLSDLEAERDYFRQVAERLGRKALADAQDFSQMIRDLRRREDKLQQSREELEKTIEQRTADLVTRNKELSDSTLRYDSLVKRIPHGVYTLRVRETGAMQFEYLSPPLCQILDIDPEEVKRNASLAFSLAHPDDREELESSIRAATERRIPFRWQGRFIVRQEVRWIRLEADLASTPAGDIVWNGVLSDITEHKRVERFLQDVITKNPMSIQILDKDGLTLEVNPAYKSLFGSVPPSGYSIFSDAQLLQMGMGKLFDQLRNGEIVRFPDTHFNAHDSISEFPDVPAWIRTLGFPLNDSNEKPERFVLMHENITERKLAEEAVANSNKLLQTIINTAPMRIFYKNRELHYMGCNNAFAKDAGAGCPEDLIGKDDYQLAWKEQAELYRTDDLRVIESGIPKLSYDEPQTTPEGNQIWLRTSKVPLLNESNEIIGVLGMYEDITDRVQAETDKTRLLLRQRAILDNLPMMAWLKDTESRLEMINQPYAEACGHAIDECIGKTDLDLFPEEMAKGFIADDREVCTSGRKKQAEEKISSPDGIKWHLTYKTPIYDEQGMVIGTAGIAQDITENKLAEEERERLQMQLAQAQKMEAIGQLAGGVAHDFNNMLGVIIGYSELILEEMDPSQPFRADLEEIQKAARRSADLTRQLLTFARKQTVALRVLDLNQTVEGMLSMLRRLIGENINLLWMPGNGLWPIKMDPSQIDQILANLCVNARDAIAGVGRITVATENTALTEEYCVLHAGSLPGEYVRIAVGDTGVGMDKEMLAHIFEPFFTTKGVGEGTGLGLATVYGAVKQNNGFINAYSQPGQGTTFTIYIPRYTDKIIPAAVIFAGKPITTGTETILLVEDEPMILTMATQMLVGQGYHVLTAASPWEAIRLAKEHARSIDLLMTDVIMPEMNGRDLAKHLLTISPNIKRLFMSGYTANVIEPHGVLDEGVHFIQKPFSMKDLAAAVREALEG